MMPDATNHAVLVEGLGKQYLLGGAEQHYDSFRDLLRGALLSPFRKFRTLSGQQTENLFWALEDINFSIPTGQITGVIGRNGAGKSTLLKLLSRITTPTVGQAVIRGRVASLLEVGSGFHPELTGRENIYMNASILGMRRHEVRQKLDDIVAFAEVEKFLDTPVKRYSSGMYVRLAFSVAAHVDPDVLLVDEVLAVGDAKFQQRCIGKLSEVGQQGRTVLFVSHNMGLIQDLCSHAIYLKQGRVEDYGETARVLPKYLRDGAHQQGQWQAQDDQQALRKVVVQGAEGASKDSFAYDERMQVQIEFEAQRNDADFVLAARITDELGRDILTSWDTDSIHRSTQPGQTYFAAVDLPQKLLRPGRYFLTVMMRNHEHGFLQGIEEASVEFEVTNIGFLMNQNRFGVVLPTLDWQCRAAK